MRYELPSYRILLDYNDLVPEIISCDSYNHHKRKGNLKIARKAAPGQTVEIYYDSLTPALKEKVDIAFPDKEKMLKINPIQGEVIKDMAARKFYSKYLLDDGNKLPPEHQNLYARQADWLNMIIKVKRNKSILKEWNINMTQFWQIVMKIHKKDPVINPKLPEEIKGLRNKVNVYIEQGYEGLIDWRFGNKNSQKVNPKIEFLLKAIHHQYNCPFLQDVVRIYDRFMNEKEEIVDLIDGEVYNPRDYYVKGKPFVMSVSTVKLYLNKIGNKTIVDKDRMSNLDFQNSYRPHMIRKGPFYAFSKVTMDDTSSPWKQLNGVRPATYKIFDVASEALITMVMTREGRPNAELIREMVRNMLRMIAQKGWKVPHEIEMERAITSGMAGKILKKGEFGSGTAYPEAAEGEFVPDVFTMNTVFPLVRFCAPKNPQEKRAEGFIKRLKLGFQRHYEGFQKRPFAKMTALKENEDMKDVKFAYEDIERFEKECMEAWNNTLHPDQETYCGLTRWQVLEQYQNPALVELDLQTAIPYVGLKTTSSVRRMRIQVQGKKYELPDANLLFSLNDRPVQCYYLPDEQWQIPEVYVYQDGKFKCVAKEVAKFQEAAIEQTLEDKVVMGKQKRYIEDFDRVIAEQKAAVPRIGTIKSERPKVEIANEIVYAAATEDRAPAFKDWDFAAMALEDI